MLCNSDQLCGSLNKHAVNNEVKINFKKIQFKKMCLCLFLLVNTLRRMVILHSCGKILNSTSETKIDGFICNLIDFKTLLNIYIYTYAKIIGIFTFFSVEVKHLYSTDPFSFLITYSCLHYLYFLHFKASSFKENPETT